MKPALAYVRVSTNRQDLGCEVQVDLIQKYAAANGFEIVGEPFEDRITGDAEIGKRKQLLALLDRLEEGGIDAVLVSHRDRIARNLGVLYAIEQAVANSGARLLSADGDSDDESPDGQLRKMVKDAFAVYEKLRIRLRTKLGLARKVHRNERVSGPVPYGYALDPVTLADPLAATRLLPHPDEQSIIATVRAKSAEGYSLGAIADLLDASGVRSRVGRKFEPTQLARILRRA